MSDATDEALMNIVGHKLPRSVRKHALRMRIKAKIAAHKGTASTGAAFHRGKSKNDYSTPIDFIAACTGRFGPFDYDLACEHHNAKVPLPSRRFTPEHDSLAPKTTWPQSGLCWLNPPYSNIAPWAKKCYESDSRILFLVPASVGSAWFQNYVMHKAYVLFLSPRLSFDGKNPYPKDCILAVYGGPTGPGFDAWRWK